MSPEILSCEAPLTANISKFSMLLQRTNYVLRIKSGKESSQLLLKSSICRNYYIRSPPKKN